jgi:hypothetical protein
MSGTRVTRGGVIAVAAGLAALALTGAPAAGQSAYDCHGDVTGGFPNPRQSHERLVFGIYPGGTAGQIAGGSAEAKPDDPGQILAALRELRGDRAFAVHLYLEFTGAADQEQRVQEAEAQLARYASAGYEVEYVLTYRPRARRGDADVAAYVQFVRAMVARLGPGLEALQVTNEVTNTASPDASDGAYPGARDALVQGVLAAKEEALARGLPELEIGFNWFYRLDPATEQGFWSELAAKGGPRFAASVDWVGVDAYPGTFFPPAALPRGDSLLNAVSLARECLMPIAGLGKTVPIHVTENGWPTGAGRSPEEQELALREMVGAIHRFRANYGVTDYRWFDLRDADSSNPNFQQQYGLMRDDYAPKPAFAAYRELVAAHGAAAATPETGEPQAAPPRIRLKLRPRRIRAATVRRLRFRALVLREGRMRPLAGARIRVAGRRRTTRGRGRASLVLRIARPGVRRVLATKPGYRAGRARLRVRASG